MTAERYDPAGKVLRIGLAALIVVLILQSAVGFIKPLAFDSFNSGPFGPPDRLVLLDLERNNGLPDLVSTLAIVAAAVGALILARFDKPFRPQAAALSALLLIIALEDVMQDEAGSTSESALFVAATVLTAAVLIVAALRRAPFRAGLCLLLGLVSLGLAIRGAYTYDQLLNVLGRGDEHRGEFDYELGIVIKQALELAGWSLVAIGLWATAFAARARSETVPTRDRPAAEPASDPR
jgi:hypothetical protein